MMKGFSCKGGLAALLAGLCVFGACSEGWSQEAKVKMPEAVQSELQDFMKTLREGSVGEDGKEIRMTHEEYAKALITLGWKAKRADESMLAKLRAVERPSAEQVMLELALEMQEAAVRERVRELGRWYGCFEYELPEAEFKGNFKTLLEEEKKEVEVLRRELKAKARHFDGRRIGGDKVVPLRKEHAGEDSRAAWMIWVLAPPSREKFLMEFRMVEGLKQCGDERVIPLLVEGLKTDMRRIKNTESSRRAVARKYEALISDFPGEKALDALLECNRFMHQEGLNGEWGKLSNERYLVTLLTSRPPLIDPLGEGVAKKASEAKLVNDHWKVYQPLVEERLETAGLPEEDAALLKKAQQAMPVE
ncbi:hypothetical protein [Rubritalea squalenifaciens]|nr:hypothetical protein [Rubritalea squalenifaciens]